MIKAEKLQYKIPKNLEKKYPGKVVAIVNGKVVATGDDYYQVSKEAERKYKPQEVLLHGVPGPEEKYLVV